MLGTPEIGGLTSIQGIEILRGCRGLNIVGGDMVEVRNKLLKDGYLKSWFFESPMETETGVKNQGWRYLNAISDEGAKVALNNRVVWTI